jgi:hypothetical protein
MRTIPVIAADMTAYKLKPKDPDGIEVLHRDRYAGLASSCQETH